MHSKRTLSVIVPNYNHAHYISEALQAILDQSHQPLEVIVIDDASTDNSVAVIEEFARKYPIVRLYRNEQNQGVISLMSRALNLAVGDYVHWAAADDRICPGLYEKSMELLAKHPDAGLCSSLLQLLDKDGKDKGWVRSPVISKSACFLPPDKVVEVLTSHGFWFMGQTVIHRRDAAVRELANFMPELRHHTDQFLYLIISLQSGACFIPEVLATWRVLDSGYAETMFSNVELSRTAFEKVTQLMRSPKYAGFFPEKFTKVWESRGWYSIEALHLRRLLHRNQMSFHSRLRELRPRPTLLDRFFFAALKLLALTHELVADTYLWHRRINWDFPWVARMLRSRYSKLPNTTRPHVPPLKES